jgi:hypothetical protein
VAGQPKPIGYAQGISRPTQADDSRWIHLEHGRDRQSILVTLSTWRCICIQIVRKISLATSWV